MAKTKEYENLVTVHAQKLFHLVFCVVRDEELASRVVEKVFVTAYSRFFEMEQEDFEKYLFQLAAKTAVTCNKTTKKQQRSEKIKKQSSINSSIIEEQKSYSKLISKPKIHIEAIQTKAFLLRS
ncbi:hypothetical protein [Niallia nealsonii]|uniref:RNA polymerase sigma-70 region 2 domain-containing protein n=1 Tax=Niallia nealsonii TaxID=115979 RepID=A0A2N0Z196_9BACI|nr:hypothetical protein [Niallia nealsonii]PKG23281.1 hypothetical protein CWS01_12580 [Niallia nealsonii]